jgi:hypothetical protein
MSQIDLLLTPEGDLDISNGLQLTAAGGESIAQKVKIRLLTFYREWILNTEAGTRWFEIVLRKGATEYTVNQEIRKRVLQTEGVRGIENFSSSFDEPLRTFSCKFSIVTDQDETVLINLNNLEV